jgi:hypothetical protein
MVVKNLKLIMARTVYVVRPNGTGQALAQFRTGGYNSLFTPHETTRWKITWFHFHATRNLIFIRNNNWGRYVINGKGNRLVFLFSSISAFIYITCQLIMFFPSAFLVIIRAIYDQVKRYQKGKLLWIII